MMAQARSVSNDCYIFAGSKEGVTCDGCRHKKYCDDLESQTSRGTEQ